MIVRTCMRMIILQQVLCILSYLKVFNFHRRTEKVSLSWLDWRSEKTYVTKQDSSIPNHWLPGSKLGVDLKSKIPQKKSKMFEIPVGSWELWSKKCYFSVWRWWLIPLWSLWIESKYTIKDELKFIGEWIIN